jgi:hypothetical protein
MNLELTPEQAEALEILLEQCLPELSHEIADTDNAEYRSKLTRRREGFVVVQKALARLLASPAFPHKSEAEGLERELAHPGD